MGLLQGTTVDIVSCTETQSHQQVRLPFFGVDSVARLQRAVVAAARSHPFSLARRTMLGDLKVLSRFSGLRHGLESLRELEPKAKMRTEAQSEVISTFSISSWTLRELLSVQKRWRRPRTAQRTKQDEACFVALRRSTASCGGSSVRRKPGDGTLPVTGAGRRGRSSAT